jgi:hypothetical protein
MNIIKILSIVLVIIVVLNLIFFALGRVNGLYFWIIIGMAALCTYVIIPRIKN